MSRFEASLDRDANHQIIPSGLPFRQVERREYTGASGLGAIGATTLFTVTGSVAVRVFGICSEDIVGAATLEVGIAGSTAGILAQIADASTLDNGEVYIDGTPALLESVDLSTGVVVTGSQNIIETIGAANITDGIIDFVCFWRPLSNDGKVVAA